MTMATTTTGTLTACGGGTYPSSQRPPKSPRMWRPAGPQPAAEEPSGPKVQQRYGFWVGAIDALATTVFLGSIVAEDDNGGDTTASLYLRIGGLLSYAFVTPIMHRAKDNGWGAGGSFLLRTTLPLATTVVAELAFGCNVDVNDRCELAAPLGLAVGAAVTTAIDAFYLARRWVPARSVRASRLRIAPLAIVNGDRQMLGLGGQF